MHMLYDSIPSCGPHVGRRGPVRPGERRHHAPEPQLVRHGFEIVDKRSGKEVYLDGSWAEMFQQQIQGLAARGADQEEVEDILDR